MPESIPDKINKANPPVPAQPRRVGSGWRGAEDEPLAFHDDGTGEVVLAEIPRLLPRDVGPLREWEDRARLAAHISRHFFTVSQRTLEEWPVRTTTLHKRALLNTKEPLAHARKMLDAAKQRAVMGGSSRKELETA
jgi:hypothetical protein